MSTAAALLKPSLSYESLLLLEAGQRRSFAPRNGEWLIGRSENATIRATDLDVSAKHALLRIDGDRAWIRDLGSTNGTFLNGLRLASHQQVELPTGNVELKLGQSVILQLIANTPVPETLPPESTGSHPSVAPSAAVALSATSAPSTPSEPNQPRPDTLVERARKRAMAEIETIQAEAVRFAESTQEEALREAARIREQTQRDIAVLQAAIAELRREREKAHTECQDIKTELETLTHSLERARGQYATLVVERDQLQGESRALAEEITTQDARNEELRLEHAKLLHDQKSLHAVRTELTEAENALRSEKAQLAETREHAARERSVWDAEDRRRTALDSALEAELNLKRLASEARLGETDLKRLEAEREIQRLLTRQQDAEREAEKIRMDADRHWSEAERRAVDAEKRVMLAQESANAIEQEAQKSREKAERFKREIEQRQSAIQDQEATLTAIRRKIEETTHEAHAAQANLEEIRVRIATESEALRLATQDEIAALKNSALEEFGVQKKLAAEAGAALRLATQAEIEREAAAKRAQLEQEFADRGRAMERELADAKVREMKVIQGMQEEERRAARTRIDAIHSDIVSRTLSLARQRPIEQAEEELRGSIRAALEGKTTASLSLDANERTRRFWKKMAIRASIPAGIALFFVIFPGIPGAIKERFSQTVASEKNDTGVFLDQIKQRGMKFQPEMNQEYRSTYSDNLLYVEGYAELKLSDAEQKEWTLLLNDFIVGRLGLSDRVIPEFISEESVMVRELMRIREGILPQFLDQGLARLAETENAGRVKLEGLLQGPENYARFRAFEKSFHDGFLRRKGLKHSY